MRWFNDHVTRAAFMSVTKSPGGTMRPQHFNSHNKLIAVDQWSEGGGRKHKKKI